MDILHFINHGLSLDNFKRVASGHGRNIDGVPGLAKKMRQDLRVFSTIPSVPKLTVHKLNVPSSGLSASVTEIETRAASRLGSVSKLTR